MPETADDPREVLSILNSLGFVGITAKQLQAFMKDLKMHRKIKERQHQQWEEETKRKIFYKQQQSLRDFMNDSPDENASPNIPDHDSVVKIKIKCMPSSEASGVAPARTAKPSKVLQRKQSPSPPRREQKPLKSPSATRRRENRSPEHYRTQRREKPASNHAERAVPNCTRSAPELAESQPPLRGRSTSVASDSARGKRAGNDVKAVPRSRSKSFIRPWKLQPEASRVAQKIKSDPVMLYQKYQKEWKKVSFFGDNRHDDVRWAIREKMLGTDPTPRPILKKSISSMSIRKR